MTKTRLRTLPLNLTPEPSAFTPKEMNARKANIRQALETLHDTTGEATFTPDLVSGLPGLLGALQDRCVTVCITAFPNTRSFLATVIVPEPLMRPEGGTFNQYGSATDRNPVVAILYALHTARGGTLDEGEYPA